MNPKDYHLTPNGRGRRRLISLDDPKRRSFEWPQVTTALLVFTLLFYFVAQ